MSEVNSSKNNLVLFDELPTTNGRSIGIATLNSEKTLNALGFEMVQLLKPQLDAWSENKNIVCVVLQGAGDKAFCAGGDIIQLYNDMKSDVTKVDRFFTEEYQLDYTIHTYNKPIVLWGNGVVMGGGLGLMSGCSHRVVTENTRMAMPEVTIGLFPDVGGTWFLNRAPGRTGLFLGLTGASINAADAIFIGLADKFIANDKRQDVIDQLAAIDWSQGEPDSLIESVLTSFEAQSETLKPAPQVESHFDHIQAVTDGSSLTDIVAGITSYQGEDKWLSKAAAGLAQGCPTTVHLIWEQMQRGEKLSLESVFQMELVMAMNCSRFGNFQEGVRALLVEKDKNPQFKPATLEEVTPGFVEQHFKLPEGVTSTLNL